jgi:aryl-alcohol dehydrogenase-like predicted oxidoreductase
MKRTTLKQAQPAGRRAFLKTGGAMAAGLLAQPAAEAASPAGPPIAAPPMPTRNLGRTGYKVGIFSLGGQASVELPNNEAVAVPIIERALDLGVNYIDTSSVYGGVKERWSERYIGQVMKRRRSETFLTSKTHERSRDESLRRLEESLKHLQTDHLDLWQLHDMEDKADLDGVFGKGGAMEALVRARDQKMVRYLGVTGHYHPDVLMECIRRFPFDTVLMAINAADRHRFSYESELLPLAVERQMGIIAMKVPGRGQILSSFKPPAPGQQKGPFPPAKSSGTLTMREAMNYVLTLPISTCIIGCDTVAHVEENVRIAREFTPLSAKQMAALSEKARPVADQALFFRMIGRPPSRG